MMKEVLIESRGIDFGSSSE